MANGDTFTVPTIGDMVKRYLKASKVSVAAEGEYAITPNGATGLAG